MEFILVILIILLVAGFTFLFFAIRKKPEDNQSLLLLQQQVQEIARTLDRRMGESHESMQRQFHESTQIIQNVTERLTKLDETNRQVVSFADQLKNLQDILKNPKQRGVLGEYYLETVLKNVLPPGSYAMQHPFSDGTIVDAAVFVKDKIIPVDSKFSLENYERILATHDETERAHLEKLFKQDLKTRIDETSKYIKPSENTMDFAFMFIPSEAIYYDLLINKVGAVQVSTQDLIEYAFKEKHVIIVSPTSFLAYLQTVLQGLRALQIEESAKEIQKNVEALKKHLVNYEEYVKKMGTQLGTLVGTYNTGYKELKKIDKDIFRIAGGEQVMEPVLLEKPREED